MAPPPDHHAPSEVEAHPRPGRPDPKPPRTVTIIVNGERHEVRRDSDLSFEEVVALAFDDPPTGPNWYLTVTFRRGGGQRPDGALVAGQSVKVKEGMVFNVTATDKS
jgi:hypothetical protein